LSLSGSKPGFLYLINDDAMGGTTADNSNARQILSVNSSSTSLYTNLHGSPVYFKDNNNKEYVYAWASSTSDAPSYLKQFVFDRNTMIFDTLNTIIGNTKLPVGKPGAMLSISSNQSRPGTGIVWASHPINGNANHADVPGELQAFDATDVTHELWNSNWNAGRDSIGRFAKFVNPTIANGKVYMATFSNELNVYGLNPPAASPCSKTLPNAWYSADIGYTAFAGDVCNNNGTYTITASGNDINGTTDAFHYYYQPLTSGFLKAQVRINSIQHTNPAAKCGIMFRSNLDPGAPYVFIALQDKNGITVQSRNGQNNTTTTGTGLSNINAPYWLRIIVQGNNFIAYVSADGNTWVATDTVVVALGPQPYVGIAYTCHNNLVLGRAVFDNLSIASLAPPGEDIINLTAKNVGNKCTDLAWTTTNDLNADHFEIERSSSTTNFSTITSLMAKGVGGGINTYTSNDSTPLNGTNFYRIKEVAKGGNFTYSSVVKVRFDLDAMNIFPNPVKNKLFIQNNSHFTNNENLLVVLEDFSGQVIARQKYSTAGQNVLTFNIPGQISRGIYVVCFTNSTGEKQARTIYVTH
jgi:hypothetical protein